MLSFRIPKWLQFTPKPTRVVYKSNVNPDDWVIARGYEQINHFKKLGWTPVDEREFKTEGYALNVSS